LVSKSGEARGGIPKSNCKETYKIAAWQGVQNLQPAGIRNSSQRRDNNHKVGKIAQKIVEGVLQRRSVAKWLLIGGEMQRKRGGYAKKDPKGRPSGKEEIPLRDGKTT